MPRNPEIARFESIIAEGVAEAARYNALALKTRDELSEVRERINSSGVNRTFQDLAKLYDREKSLEADLARYSVLTSGAERNLVFPRAHITELLAFEERAAAFRGNGVDVAKAVTLREKRA